MSPSQRDSVVLFTSSFLMGGMEEHVLQLGRGLVQRGYTVAAICSAREELLPLRQRLAVAGVRVHSLPERRGSLLEAGRRLGSLVQVLRQSPGAVLHLHLPGYPGGDLVQIAGRLAGVRAIVRTEHDPVKRRVSPRERTLQGLRDRAVDRIIYVSEQVRQNHLAQLGRDPGKTVVVPNGVDLDEFSPNIGADAAYEHLGLRPTDPIVGTIARLREPNKGINYFLEMAAKVVAVCPQARFVVVGEGPLRAELERQAESLKIAHAVIFTGRVPTTPPFLAAMRVFVMPSLSEGGPFTVLEALAMAKPVVSTPVGIVPELIEDHVSGLLAPVRNSDALARAVLEVLGNDTLATRLGERGRAAVAAHYSLDATIDGNVAVYQQVAASTRSQLRGRGPSTVSSPY